MPKYFDIHSQPQFPEFDKDRVEVIGRMKETSTYTIAIGVDLESSKKAVELAEKNEEIFASIGIHPVDNPAVVFEKEEFEALVSHPKVVMVGECGLDFHHADRNQDYDRQRKLFLDQIDFALEYNKPLMIHARDAYAELLEMLEQLKVVHGKKLRGNVHFFAGNSVVAKRLFDIGFTISFTGVITFTSDYNEVIKSAPLEMIMSETDAPYVAPVPYRGKRNEPSYVMEVVKRIAEVRGEDEEVVRTALVNNALSMIR